jgi:hypothetical protein
MTITAADKLACAEREIKQRERVYERLIQRGDMSVEKARRELALMRAIAEDYRAQAEGERLL